jgi:hypothetical protein
LPPGRFAAPGSSFFRTAALCKAGTGAGNRIFRADETILGNPRNQPETNRGYFYGHQSGAKPAWEAQMNHSIHSLDRSTHLKIVVLALVAGMAVAGFGFSARSNADYTQTAHVIKAGKPVVVTSSDAMLIR